MFSGEVTFGHIWSHSDKGVLVHSEFQGRRAFLIFNVSMFYENCNRHFPLVLVINSQLDVMLPGRCANHAMVVSGRGADTLLQVEQGGAERKLLDLHRQGLSFIPSRGDIPSHP